jgi:uncharacterized protein (DUF305 family)
MEFEMKKLVLVIGLASVLLGTGLAQMSGMNHGAMGTKSTAALKNLSGRAYDIAWMSQMIEHHRGALEMAQPCVKGCTRAELRRAAQTIVGDQGKEIRQLEGWLRSWYNAKPDARQMALMREDMKPMMLAAQGGMAGMTMGDANRNFLEGMIPHHEHAVMMGRDAIRRASRAELKKFAQGVVTLQTKEIKQFRAWLKAP